ncbi:MAG: hypothetical protein AB1757_30280 [Acidobacteriota bacterium]
MKSLATFLILLLLVSLAPAQTKSKRITTTPPAATAQPAKPALPIRRVILYSNGVAYFERRGQVNGHAEINLPFKQSQVDDVLKSMVVLDLNKGRIGAVSYNSSAPSSARLAEIPFAMDAGTNNASETGGLAGVLQQLQGARVAITSSTNQTAIGAILTVEERKAQIDANKPPMVSHSLVLVSESGEISRFMLEDLRSVKLLDEGARHDIKEFADASAAARRRDAKTITVTSDGAGAREMIVSYTVAAPIWKTTYRIVVDQTGKPFFQGWAIVDNVSDEDWTDVSLSLVSGTPISFIQPIQQPLYRYRPVVPLPEDLQLTPQTYDPDDGTEANMGIGGSGSIGSQAKSIQTEGASVDGGRFNQKKIESLPLNARNFLNLAALEPGVAAEPKTSISDLITGKDSGVQTAATGNEVGDLFEYRVDQPITVQRNRSALIPILQTQMTGERVSIYNDTVRKDRPLSGLRLKNTSQLTLEGGSLTIIDGDAYAGETLMERLKPGEFRFISYALDLGTLVTSTTKADREPTFFVRIINGAFEAHYYQTSKKIYAITNQTDKPRVVYIQHPARDGWTLSDDTPKPAAKTNTLYGFRVEVEPRKTVELAVTERQTLVDSYAVSEITPQNIEVFVSRKYLDADTKTALEKILEIKGKIVALNQRIAAVEGENEEITTDQERLRENIKALKDTPETKQLIARYVAKANEQESRLEEINKEKRAALEESRKFQAELQVAIRALNLNRKL